MKGCSCRCPTIQNANTERRVGSRYDLRSRGREERVSPEQRGDAGRRPRQRKPPILPLLGLREDGKRAGRAVQPTEALTRPGQKKTINCFHGMEEKQKGQKMEKGPMEKRRAFVLSFFSSFRRVHLFFRPASSRRGTTCRFHYKTDSPPLVVRH